MTYQFAGFFCPFRIARPTTLPAGAVWREIARPFVGIGVRLPEFVGKSPETQVIQDLANSLGFGGLNMWLYLSYDCWGGRIDFVYGYGLANGKTFGPVEESALDAVEDTYISIMSRLGIDAEEALRFPPFERGFWGES